MTAATFFDRIDPADLSLATDHFATTFIGAQLRSAGQLVHDSRVSPTALIAGLCRAHAFGLASAIAAARQLVTDNPDHLALLRGELAEACITLIRAELAKDVQ